MMFSDAVTLIGEGKAYIDANGYERHEEVRTDVFADVRNVRRTEFYEAMRAGLQASKAITIRECDYAEQKEIEHEGKRYAIVRTYSTDGEWLEITCAEKKR